MQTFDQALFDLYEGRHVSYEDALRNADSVNDLRLQIKLNSDARPQRRSVGRHRAPDDRLSRGPPGGRGPKPAIAPHHRGWPGRRSRARPLGQTPRFANPRQRPAPMKTLRTRSAATSGLSRPGRDGPPDGRTPGARRPLGHRLQPHGRQGRSLGGRVWRRSGGNAARGGRRCGVRVFAASAMTTTCAAWCSGRDGAFAGMSAWRRVCRSHHRIGRGGARTARRRRGARPALHRCARLRRAGGRGERRADRDVRWRPAALRRDASGGSGLRACGHPGRCQRRRPVGQDGQPGLHRRPGAGPGRRHRLRTKGRARHEAGARGHRQGRRPELAAGQPRRDDGGRPLRLRLCRRLDAQGPRPGPRRSAAQRRAPCR